LYGSPFLQFKIWYGVGVECGRMGSGQLSKSASSLSACVAKVRRGVVCCELGDV
jgi:hypothetical protein